MKYKLILSVLSLLFAASLAQAYVASSNNYRIEVDSINFGGGFSNSANYQTQTTGGEVGSGDSSSANYVLRAGYQAMASTTLSISSPGNVTISTLPGNDHTAGTSDKSIAWTVKSPAGYLLTVRAATSPALETTTSGLDSFDDYAPIGAADYDWIFLTTQAFFGFSLSGTDVAGNYRSHDSGGGTFVCGSGVSSSGHCWDGFSTGDKSIATASGSNLPDGSVTNMDLRVSLGSSKSQSFGDYQATVVATAVVI